MKRRSPNSRFGIPATNASPSSLPPLAIASAPSPRRAPLAQLQDEELTTLQTQFADRVRAQKQLCDASQLLQLAKTASSTVSDAHDTEGDGLNKASDVFAQTKQTIRSLEPKCQHTAQFLSTLVSHIEELVQLKLHKEIDKAAAHPQMNNRTNTHTLLSPSVDNREDNEAEDDSSSDSNSNNSEKESDREESPDREENQGSPRRKQPDAWNKYQHPSPPTTKFRTTLRCRKFPPTRVPDDEHIAVTTTYTPFGHRASGVNAGELQLTESTDADENRGKEWTVVLFPRTKPSLNHTEIDAFIQWAERKLEDARVGSSNEGDQAGQFQEQMKLRELLCYELTRLVFDKCPTTARFLHGLFVELTEIVAQTMHAAERDARIMSQHQKNAQLELQRLQARRTAMEGSLYALQDTMRRRQQHLLTERERIIRQRKKLNLLLAADQILIRHVIAVLQHGVESAEEILTAKGEGDGRTSTIDALTSLAPPTTVSPPYTALDELYEIVGSKFATLPEVLQAKRNYDKQQLDHLQAAQDDIVVDDSLGQRKVIVLDTKDIVLASEEFKSALPRLTRLLTTKCPDSSVGWAAEELWDQALFIPSPEDVQDLDRDVQRLCAQVETVVLKQRRQRAIADDRVNVDTQTDITTCGPPNFRGRTRANGLMSLQLLKQNMASDIHSISPAPSSRRSAPTTTTLSTTIGASGRPIKAKIQTPRLALLQETNLELFERFLPEALRLLVRSIPVDYEPRQLSLVVVHGLISYVFNEMWSLIQQENLQNSGHGRRAVGMASTAHPLLISVRSIHEYLYRIYLEHFQTSSFAVCRLLDLLISASRLDTQSCKVLLFCRLLGLPGTDPLPEGSFWFLIKSIHVLQRACTSSGNYFLLDANGINEFVPQASAWDAMNQLFHNATKDIHKRLRMRLAGLASVYGAVWIPAYNVIDLIIEEWTVGQVVLRTALEDKMFIRNPEVSTDHQDGIVSYTEFLSVFERLNLRTSRLEVTQMYHQLLTSAKQKPPVTKSGSASDGLKHSEAIDVDRFNEQWVSIILRAINQSQHQQIATFNGQYTHRKPSSTDGSSGNGAGTAVHFGPPPEAQANATQKLSYRFLKATWEQTKPDFIHWLDLQFHDIGLQVRLVQHMDSICSNHETNVLHAWRNFQQLIQIAAVENPDE